MNTNKLIVAGLIGTVVAFITGFLIWGLALSGFMESNMGSATGVARGENEMLWIPLILGNAGFAFLLSYIYGRWASISTFQTGAKAGAVIGLLAALGYDMIMLATTHIMNSTAAIVDIAASGIHMAIVGGVIGWWFGRGN